MLQNKVTNCLKVPDECSQDNLARRSETLQKAISECRERKRPSFLAIADGGASDADEVTLDRLASSQISGIFSRRMR